MEFSQVGKYKIIAEIGQGSMGQVFRAHDPVLGRDVALKTISAKIGVDEEMRKRFQREAQAAARLNHPHIVTVFDFGEEGGRIYIAMELLEGVDLKDFMASGALTSLGARLEVMDQILEALAFAHSKGVVHRDLKPANIHVLRSGQLKLMDFGLARIGSAADTTKAGTVLGTPNYMSPEQVLGERADFRSDVFSAGAVLYELLSGRKPFDAESVHAVLFQVVHKEPAPLSKCAPDTPAALVTLVERALSKDAGQRFRDAGELRAALGRARASISGVRPPALGRVPVPPVERMPSPAPPAGTAPDPEATLAVDMTPSIEGTSALAAQPQPQPQPTPRPSRSSPTLSARAATQIDPARSRVRPRPAAAHDHSRWRRLVPLVLVFGLVSGVGVSYLAMHRLAPSPTPAPPPATGPDVHALTRTLADTQVRLAQRVLEDKDYRAAMAQAEQALKVDPGNAPARDVVRKARGALAELDAAARQANSALDAGETQRAADALSRILALDPRHPSVAELTARLNGVFRAKAEEARRLASEARKSAERSDGASAEGFDGGSQRVREAEASFAKGEFAAATQGFLEARDGFDRARRTGAARSVPASVAPVQQAKLEPAPATVPAAPPSAAEPVASAAPVAPPPAARLLVAGRSVAESARSAGGNLAGFESQDVSVRKTPDFIGRIEFEINPPAVRPGDSYRLRVELLNDGRKEIEVRSVTLTTTVNGVASPREVTAPVAKLASRQRKTLAELDGVWDEGISSWSLDVLVTSSKGDTCRNRLELK